MPTIAIIDDNTEQSRALSIILNHHLKKLGSDLVVITQTPFVDIEDYFRFIEEKEVCEFILDERLHEQPDENDLSVDYQGNDLVVELRKRLKYFPIFMVSSFNEDEEVQEKFSFFDGIFRRDEIAEDAGEKYSPIFLRAAHRYLEANQKELEEFNRLAKIVAVNPKDEAAQERLQALQVKLELPTISPDRSIWLEKYEQKITELEAFKEKLESKLRKE